MPALSLHDFQQQTPALVDQVRRLVEMESPTTDKVHVDALGAYIAERCVAAGAAVASFPQSKAGDHRLASWGKGQGGLLLLAHLDTVHPIGTLRTMPWSVDSGRATGPGSIDMKGGIVVGLAAIEALVRAGRLPENPVRFLFTTDEETGSHTSRALIEEQARLHRAVFCLEPAMPEGALKTWRKGTGVFTLEVGGVASHAGNNPEGGVNAVVEMAHQILKVQALARPEAGTTVSVGIVEGGTRTNVVPARCRAKVDVRALEPAEQDRISEAMGRLTPVLRGATVQVSGGWNRPPMPRTPQMAETFSRAQTIARRLGLDLHESGTGGGSDANFVAALGQPVLDGLGPVGNGAHSDHEFVIVESLAERAALLAALLTDW